MLEVLFYLYQTYYTPQACPPTEVLARRLAAAGFEDADIDDALGWLMGLAQSTQDFGELAGSGTSQATRVYTEDEQHQLGVEAIGLVMFLESSGVLSTPVREIILERASACYETPVSVETMKLIALMVLWSQEIEVDHLIMEELLRSDEDGISH